MKKKIQKREMPLPKQTKMGKVKNLCGKNESIFSCPACRGSITLQPQGDLLCENKHCFNLARKGYINFVNAAHESFYDEELFAARGRIFQRGFYEPVAKTLNEKIAFYQEEWGRENPFNILDIGCGEGYYLDYLKERFSAANCFGIDLSKEAVKAAAAHESECIWAVADLTKVPFRNKTFHVLLNILTPANYEEFGRIQKKQGIVLKVSPGKEYLKEIRERFFSQEYNENRVTEYSRENMEVLEEHRISYTKNLEKQDWRDFLYMTPLTVHKEEERIKQLEAPSEKITIDLNLVVGRLKGNLKGKKR